MEVVGPLDLHTQHTELGLGYTALAVQKSSTELKRL